MISTNPGVRSSIRCCMKPGQGRRFLAQPAKSRAFKNLQRGQQRCRRQYGRIADLPALRAADGTERRAHLETSGRVVTPPSREARQTDVIGMPFMNETTADGAGSRVEIFVAAHTAKSGVPIVQLQQRIADGMRKIHAHRRTHAPRGGNDWARDPATGRSDIARRAAAPVPGGFPLARFGAPTSSVRKVRSPLRGVTSMRCSAAFNPWNASCETTA